MTPSPSDRKDALLAKINKKLPADITTPEPPLKITHLVDSKRLAEIDNLLGVVNGTAAIQPTSVEVARPPVVSDLTGHVTFYTSFGGGTINPTSTHAIKLPYTTGDPVLISLIKSTYGIGSLTCPIKMKMLG